MKFTVLPGELKTAFASAKMALSSKNSMPVLENILVEPTDENKLKLTASDGDNTIIVTMNCEEVDGMKPVLIPANFMDKFVSGALNEWPVTFEIEENRLVISDLMGEFETGCETNVNDYPQLKPMNDAKTVKVPSNLFVESTALALGYTSNDTCRPIMNGVNYDFSAEGLRIGASDQKRLYMDTLKSVVADEPMSITMNKKMLACVSSLLSKSGEDELEITMTDKMVRVGSGNVIIYGRIIEGKYPRIASVVPKNNDRVVIVNRDGLISMVKRALISSSEATKQVVLTFDGGKHIQIKTQDIDFGHFANVNYESVSQSNISAPLTIGFRGNFLLDILSTFKGCETVAILMSDPFRATIIKATPEADRLTLLMPMQVQE